MNALKVILVSTLLVATMAAASQNPDFVEKMPDMDEFPFNFYSGYLDITTTGRSLHYFFEESQNTPADDPLVLWLNGGPGCSSVLGWATEHGYMVNEDDSTGKWSVNPHSWNTAANMIYLESPGGVGFSTAGSDGPKIDDVNSAKQNLLAMIGFFKKFPEYQGNEFYISGESYGGIYVPLLAYQIHEYNKTATTKINLKGIMVGNGATDWNFDCNPAMVEMAFTHALVSKTTQEGWIKNKCSAPNGHIFAADDLVLFESMFLDDENVAGDQPSVCDALWKDISLQLNDINLYNLYMTCEGATDEQSVSPYAMKPKQFTAWLAGNENLRSNLPCLTYETPVTYFRRDDVKKALHISAEASPWDVCNDGVSNTYVTDYEKGSIYYYPTLISAGYRIWHYSGDVDLAVPYVGTQNWINNLDLPVKDAWRQWKITEQVAGYVEVFDGITFVTVKGTGHMVPQWKRPEALHILTQFLADDKL